MCLNAPRIPCFSAAVESRHHEPYGTGEKLRLQEQFPKPDYTLESPEELLKNKPGSLGLEPRVKSFLKHSG